jgi:hypothetical protein
VSLPASGKWLLKILAREHRFVFGVYRRQLKAIGYLGEIDRLFGMPATTRNWNTITAVAKALDNGRIRPTGKPSLDRRGVRELLPNKPMQRTAIGRQ